MPNYYFDEAPFTTYGEFNPIPVFSTTNGGHTVKALQASNSIRFASSSATIAINNYTSTAAGRTYVLFQDGIAIETLVIPATGGGSYADRTIATGLDTGSVHEYEIACVLPIQGSASNWYDSHLILDDLASVAHPTRAVLAFYGDSITGVTDAGGTVADTRDADMWQACTATGRAMTISGVAGGKVVNTGRDSTANINASVDQVHVRYGVNDLPDLTGGSPNTTFQTAYGDMIDNIRTRIGAGKPIYCYQPWPVSSGSNRATAGTLIQNAISGKSNVTYISTDNWYPTTVGYHLSALYSPIGWLSWERIVRSWEAAQGSDEAIKAFEALMQDQESPAGLRSRAEQMIVALGGEVAPQAAPQPAAPADAG